MDLGELFPMDGVIRIFKTQKYKYLLIGLTIGLATDIFGKCLAIFRIPNCCDVTGSKFIEVLSKAHKVLPKLALKWQKRIGKKMIKAT